jgi:ketosteroid isomerase-like protein
MSRENVENVRRGIDAWNRGDLDEWLDGFAPEAELHTTGRFADQGVYRGRAGLQRNWAEIREDIEELSLSISDLRAIGDRVFFAVTGRGRGKRSKVPVERPIWLLRHCVTDWPCASRLTSIPRKPSKPPGCRSRGCRRRTSRS